MVITEKISAIVGQQTYPKTNKLPNKNTWPITRNENFSYCWSNPRPPTPNRPASDPIHNEEVYKHLVIVYSVDQKSLPSNNIPTFVLLLFDGKLFWSTLYKTVHLIVYTVNTQERALRVYTVSNGSWGRGWIAQSAMKRYHCHAIHKEILPLQDTTRMAVTSASRNILRLEYVW